MPEQVERIREHGYEEKVVGVREKEEGGRMTERRRKGEKEEIEWKVRLEGKTRIMKNEMLRLQIVQPKLAE